MVQLVCTCIDLTDEDKINLDDDGMDTYYYGFVTDAPIPQLDDSLSGRMMLGVMIACLI